MLVEQRAPVDAPASLVIDSDSWASIIASVSAYGENGASRQFARLFHSSALDVTPPYRKRIAD